MKQTGRRDRNALDHEFAPLVPHGLEIEPLHHERQVDLKVLFASGAYKHLSWDDALREPSIAGPLERLVIQPQTEAGALACAPARTRSSESDGRKRSKSLVTNVVWPVGAYKFAPETPIKT